MTTKFNPKVFQGKARVYVGVPGTIAIERVWCWSNIAKQYEGSSYEARRYNVRADGSKKRDKKSFASLKEARDWQQGVRLKEILEDPALEDLGPTFGMILEEWKKRKFPSLREGTQLAYEKIVRLHFKALTKLPIRQITPSVIDNWLDDMREPTSPAMKSGRRGSFDHELTLVAVVLRYYGEYHDDPDFRFPVKKRHRESVHLAGRKKTPSRDLSEEQFKLFRTHLVTIQNGAFFASLATVQYYQALRISEAAAIYWEDVTLDEKPENSRLMVKRSVFWPRRKGMESRVQIGFKNSESNDGTKEQPLFPEAYQALKAKGEPHTPGLVFTLDGAVLEYRQIQHAYDQAFKLAGLPYRGTHVMRHGGCRRVYNAVPDTAVAQQLLGNADLQSTLIYAKRDARALTNVAKAEWSKLEAEDAGRKRSQEPAA